MKLIKIVWFFFLMLAAGQLTAQTRTISGRVMDDTNNPLPGATIVEKGNIKNAAAADVNGYFKISVKDANATVTISSVSFITATFPVGNNTAPVFALKPDRTGLNEVVVVGYSTQKRITNTGAVSSIKASEIETIPVSSIQNTLNGRLPGFFSAQRSGQPGKDAAEFYIRGVNSLNGDVQPLVIVDDIAWDYSQVSQLDANEIETISILKDAATTAVYGVRGANGVLVITTKRGQISKPKINFSTQFGLNQVIQYPTYMDAYTSAVLQNEAYMNDSYGLSSPLTLPWGPDDLRKFKDGSDPYGHPNVNWQDVLLKTHSTQKNYNIDISGGNEKVRYFTSFGYFTQDGLLKSFTPADGDNGVNPNYFYNRVNFRSNLDITPTKTLTIRFDLNGRFETINNPGGVLDADGLFKELESFRTSAALSMPLINPNGTYGFANQSYANGYVNPISRLANGGYKRNFNNNFNIVIGADQKLDFLTPGLRIKVNVNYSSTINENRSLGRAVGNLPAFYYNSATNTYTSKGPNQIPLYTLTANTNAAYTYLTNTQASLNYDRAFGNHHVYALALLNQISTVNGGATPNNFRGTTGRIGYDYKQRYLVEFNIARNGSNNFRAEQPYGVFPAISAGWNIAEEPFFKKLFPAIDLFKVRGSIGVSGSDKNYATVLSVVPYSLPGGVNNFGNGATEGGLVNPFITWESTRKTDVGLDINLFNGKVTATADYFFEHRYNQLISQNGVPLLIGQLVPKANVGISDNKGVEIQVIYKDHIGLVNYNIGGNISRYKNKVIYISEAPNYPYQAQTGRQIGLLQGYRFIGFYQQSDFDPATGKLKTGVPGLLGAVLQPGDLKYQDMNGDGLITTADQTFLSQPLIPTTTYGISFGFSYKGFSLSALLQGSFGYAINVNAEGTDAFNGNIQPLQVDDHWTPQNTNPTYARLGFSSSIGINNSTWQTVSDYTLVNGSYLRLKSLELGYQISPQWVKKVGLIRSCRLYTSGYNLLTIRNTGRFQVDPEIANGSNAGTAYPVTANYTFGIQLGF
jgi:TonB-linked SusC/RagA family outer membrane protein